MAEPETFREDKGLFIGLYIHKHNITSCPLFHQTLQLRLHRNPFPVRCLKQDVFKRHLVNKKLARPEID